ncbi:sensor histidine kinase [Pedobacter nyackensis]|uniref:sensor histidine kinase n=1 Tax=Pedobacter nyackensis TaxID=475255 RepID=UPI00292E7777|nr:histidine kinase [Pedobacter nyackensis]
MYKAYQIKWFFILSGILIVGTPLLRKEGLNDVHWWEFLAYAFDVFSKIFVCWMIHGYFFLHKFPSINNYTKHFLSNLLAIISILALTYGFSLFLPDNPLNGRSPEFSTISNFKIHFTGAFFLTLICFVVFYSVHTNYALQNSKLENQILEQAHLRAQLISLQQQISPHFLFNSLSTLKTIAKDQPTKNYIIQLAGVYRYVLNFNEHYLTPLKAEISFIRSYLYIMNERFEDALKVDIKVSEEHLELRIPPLSLQILIENAIKHNTISPERPLHISIITDDTPALTVRNNFQPKKMLEEGTGTGLKNIIERYKLLANKTINISNNAEEFLVTIPLIVK